MQQLEISDVMAGFEPVFFYAGDNEFSCFSNFFMEVIELDGKKWPSVEHYFQAMKSNSEPDQDKIRLAASPGLAKGLGRKVMVRSDWEEVKYDIMVKSLRVKFESPKLRNILLATENRPIYEDSPSDRIWGTGVLKGMGSGKNLLGIALMQVRQEIRDGQVREKTEK